MIKRLLVLVLLCAIGSAACAQKGPTEPSGFSQTITGTVPTFGTADHAFNAPRSGTLRVELTWADGGDLDLYLTVGSCTPATAASCEFLEISYQGDTKEVISRTVSNGEQLRLWVDSFVTSGPRNYTLKITID